MTTTLVIATLALMLAAYAVCGIPFGYLISKRAAGVDVRQQGSGNIGTTNVVRTVGAKAGVATLVLDVAKGFVCVFLSKVVLSLAVAGGDAQALEPSGIFGWAPAFVFLAAVGGHIFSPYLGFKGGKGIACGFGAALGLSWMLGLALLAVFVAVALPTRYVSAGSVAASVSVPFFVMLFYQPIPWGVVVPVSLAAVCAIWAHRQNVMRLKAGRESKFELNGEEGAGMEEPIYRYEDEVEREGLEDAERPPQAGVTYTFGDEATVKDEVREAEAEVKAIDDDVEDFERSLRKEKRDEGEDA